MLAAGNHFAGEQQQRFLAAIYQHELVHLRAAGMIAGFDAIARPPHVLALFGDDGFAGSERCVEGFEVGGVGVLR